MCTLSLLRWAEPKEGDPHCRVMFNRDEQRTRPIAVPPVERGCGAVRAVFPVDPLSTGTWIAATSAGLVLAVLNEYRANGDPRCSAMESRGTIIPRLLDARTSVEAVRRARDIDVCRLSPFRLIVIDADVIRELVSDGRAIRSGAPTRTNRWMCTSSSVNQDGVRAIRTASFARLVTRLGAQPSIFPTEPHGWLPVSFAALRAAQDRFHASTVPEHPGAGVRMTRADACTVSVTTVEMFADRVQMTYRPLVLNTEVPVTFEP